jgi:CxxC-x17-CxxC domain-containing protein
LPKEKTYVILIVMRDFKKPAGFAKRSFGARSSFGASRGARTFGGTRDTEPTEMHQAKCNECHKMCEVPFRPNGKKPVYCRDCYKDKEPSSSYDRGTGPRRDERGSSDFQKQLGVLNTKIDRLIAVIEEQTRTLSRSK